MYLLLRTADAGTSVYLRGRCTRRLSSWKGVASSTPLAATAPVSCCDPPAGDEDHARSPPLRRFLPPSFSPLPRLFRLSQWQHLLSPHRHTWGQGSLSSSLWALSGLCYLSEPLFSHPYGEMMVSCVGGSGQRLRTTCRVDDLPEALAQLTEIREVGSYSLLWGEDAGKIHPGQEHIGQGPRDDQTQRFPPPVLVESGCALFLGQYATAVRHCCQPGKLT